MDPSEAEEDFADDLELSGEAWAIGTDHITEGGVSRMPCRVTLLKP